MTKSLKHWYPRYSGDYRAKTAGLSLIQHGAYTLLLDEYYNTGKPLDANASVLHRICSALAQEEQEAINFILERFFIKADDGYRNKRADEELVKRGDISKKRKQAANIRHAKDVQTPMQTGCKIDANAHTSTSTSTSTSTAKKKEGENSVFPVPENVSQQTWDDFKILRASKKSPITKTAIGKILTQAMLANFTLEEALQECCTRGWQSFKAEWVNNNKNGQGNGRKTAVTGEYRIDDSGENKKPSSNRDRIMSAIFNA